jgi:hypothetical protein
MNFSDRFFLLFEELMSIDKRTKRGRDLKEQLRELWRNATNEDLDDFALYFSKMESISFEEARKRAEEIRFRHQAKKEIEEIIKNL